MEQRSHERAESPELSEEVAARGCMIQLSGRIERGGGAFRGVDEARGSSAAASAAPRTAAYWAVSGGLQYLSLMS